MKGFITLEGIEGTGKSTVIKLLADEIAKGNHQVLITREPGGSPTSEKIRTILLQKGSEVLDPTAELLLMYAARKQHLVEVIQPAIAKGMIVLCDRFSDASHAYQGAGRSLPQDRLQHLDEWVVADCQPELTLLLDAPIDVCLARTKERKKQDRFDKESHAFFTRVQQGYYQRAKQFPDRIRFIDTQQSVKKVVAAAYAAVAEHLGLII